MQFYHMTAMKSQLQIQRPHLKTQVHQWPHLEPSQNPVYQITTTTIIQQVQVIFRVHSKPHLHCNIIPPRQQQHLCHQVPASQAFPVTSMVPTVPMLSTIITIITKWLQYTKLHWISNLNIWPIGTPMQEWHQLGVFPDMTQLQWVRNLYIMCQLPCPHHLVPDILPFKACLTIYICCHQHLLPTHRKGNSC